MDGTDEADYYTPSHVSIARNSSTNVTEHTLCARLAPRTQTLEILEHTIVDTFYEFDGCQIQCFYGWQEVAKHPKHQHNNYLKIRTQKTLTIFF